MKAALAITLYAIFALQVMTVWLLTEQNGDMNGDGEKNLTDLSILAAQIEKQ